ncbi:hypothetical protein JL108_04350 [Aeromicrobium sp. YIM 150415]|uniref:hypothetical protein n=1 Tax=Aeromicrobium sp. YIM 150415 TaxID=2803912 RepID=UPI0019647F4B|nr:hypothetical protein [Aeromicrobium sp. YIM 150415]MBM9462670.1 hypothetical protein [Aeromicrobium sp. YIM 150415]
MRGFKYALTAISLAALLMGCGGTTGAKDDDPQSGSNAPSSEKGDEDTAEAAPVAEHVLFGEAYTYEDGLSVTVGAPEVLQIDPAEAEWYPEYFQEGTTNLTFMITIVNGTDTPFDPSGWIAYMQSGNVEAESIFYSEAGLEGVMGTTLLPGREGTYKVGYSVTNPDDLVMEVSPDMGIEYERFFVTTESAAGSISSTSSSSSDTGMHSAEREVAVEDACDFLGSTPNSAEELIGVLVFANDEEYTLEIRDEVRANCPEYRDELNAEIENW